MLFFRFCSYSILNPFPVTDNWQSSEKQASSQRAVRPCAADGHRMHSEWDQGGVARCQSVCITASVVECLYVWNIKDN